MGLIIGGVFLALLFSLGIGWFVFRRTLMPQAGTKLPPSGARPWSRTRVPNPDSMSSVSPGVALAGGAMMNAAAPMQMANNGYGPGPNDFNASATDGFMPQNDGYGPGPNGFDPSAATGYMPPNNGFVANQNPALPPNMQGFDSANNGFPASNGFVPQSGMNGYPPQPAGGNGYAMPMNGMNGFSDGFIPPSPQIFPQGEASMIPPGSGTFPVPANNNGFAPASSAFTAMYGLPDDPFAGSQAGSPGWLENLGTTNPSFRGPQPQQPAPNFPQGAPDLNDPYLAEVIRQYSQKSQAVNPSQPLPPPEPPAPRTEFQNPDWLQ